MKIFRTTYLKEILLSAIMLALVLGPFQPLIAQAQVSCGAGADPSTCIPSGAAAATPSTTGTASTGATTGSTAVSTPATTTQTPPTNNGTAICTVGVAECLTSIIYVFTVGIGSTFAYVAAQFFNVAINLSLNGPIYALTFISTGWTTARDLANMAFLFILIYIAFTIMLEAETSGTMSLLAGVILIALLVNFSFFFTRVVIDAGNIVSIQFYNSINAPSIASVAASGGVTGAVATVTNGATTIAANASGKNTKDLTASIMGLLNLQGLFNNASFQNFTSGPNAQSFMVQFITLSFLYIAAAMMLWGLTVTFVTAGVKFLIRIVVLWFLIIASPLAFVARAMPPGKIRGYFDQWRDMLISTAFYPVAFMFIFLILVNFCNQLSAPGGDSNLITNLFTNISSGQSNAGIIPIALAITNAAISLGFVIAILYMGMKASEKISTVGAKAAEGAGKWAGAKYTNTFGASSGFVGRYSFGLVGDKVARNATLRESASKGGLLGTLAKGARFAGNTAATSSFDFRGAPGAKGLGLGTPQKDGYRKDVEDKVHAAEKRAKDLEPDDNDKLIARKRAETEPEYAENKIKRDAAKQTRETAEKSYEDHVLAKTENSREAKELKANIKVQKALENKFEKKMKDREKQISGEGTNKKEYANYLESKRLGNFGIVTKAARQAAEHIRHEKSKDKKLTDAIKEFTKEEKEAEGEAVHAPAAPVHAPTAPTHAPAATTHAPAAKPTPAVADSHGPAH